MEGWKNFLTEGSSLSPYLWALLVSGVCGFIIGTERESKGKPAGIRTLVLICIGSSLFVQISVLLAGNYGDPARVAAQVVTGIGFLGAGAILHRSQQGMIAGLTTAASIWVTAAVGMLVGCGEYVAALVISLLVVFALRVLSGVEKHFFRNRHIQIKKVVYEPRYGKTEWIILGILEEHMIHPRDYVFKKKDRGKPQLELQYIHKNRNHRAFLAEIAGLPEIIEVS